MGYVNSDGVAVMSMDHGTSFRPANSQNRTSVSRDHRIPVLNHSRTGKSVRISSNDAFNVGTLAIIDLSHIPYGPGVWPAFWMVGPVRRTLNSTVAQPLTYLVDRTGPTMARLILWSKSTA